MPVSSPLAPRFDFAVALAREAGALALDYFRRRDSLQVKSKGVQDMASEADLNTELLIRERLAAAFPDDAFLGEETGVSTIAPGQGVWVVDPIDGTQPFISGLPSWCVSIGYVVDREIEFGAVHAPVRDELFAGGRAFPATLNGRPMTLHPGRSLAEGITAVGYSLRTPPDEFLAMFERFLRRRGIMYRDGSGALNLCDVAAGRLLGYIERHINAWDCVAAIAIIRAAGLLTSDFLAGDGLHRGNPIIAGTAAVFDELSEVYAGAPAAAS